MLKKFLIFLFICLIFFSPVLALESAPVLNELNNKIEEYQNKLNDIVKQKDTLANQLKYIDFQTNLTELKINQTEDSIKLLGLEINSLTSKISDLDFELNKLSTLYVRQIVENYKLGKRTPSYIFIIKNDFNNFLTQYKYASTMQKNSQETLVKMETTRTNFDIQKGEKEKKQLELEDLEKKLAEQKDNLTKQKEEKNSLLSTTKNDEARYQKLKLEAENELNSLVTAAFVGKRLVKKGDILGIMGNSGYSFGDHLHFGLYILKEIDIAKWSYLNDIDSDQYIKDHIWPMSGNREITQGRGRTQYAYLYSDRFHHGIDMVSGIKSIYAVNDGVAYFFRNPKSSLGNHVKLFHADGKMTLYLHMQ